MTGFDTVIEADLVGSAVRELAAERTKWEGTASGLLSALKGVVEEGVTRAKDWPSTPEALSNRLRRAATFLRKAGVSVAFHHFVEVVAIGCPEGSVGPEGLFAGARPQREIGHARQPRKPCRWQPLQAHCDGVQQGAEDSRARGLERRPSGGRTWCSRTNLSSGPRSTKTEYRMPETTRSVLTHVWASSGKR
jgi:hypothetical protein